jgi:hypothetical protein
MLHLKKLAAIATAIFLAEAPAHATDIPSADDTARFLAGMAP